MANYPILLRDTEITVLQVLEMIAEGLDTRQIISRRPQLTPADIQASALLACQIFKEHVTSDNYIEISQKIILSARNGKLINITKIRKEHPRAYEPWGENEDSQLLELHKRETRLDEIARIHKRNIGAVKSRLEKLGENI